jgi:RNA polymerase sigma-70 factor (ECF subfamily)
VAADFPDDELVARTVAGESAAFEELVRRHLGSTFGLARRLTGTESEAEDVTQEVFTRLWLKAPAWRPGAARLTTWLYRVTANLAVDAWRRRGPAAVELDPEDPAVGTVAAAEEALEADQEQARLGAAVAALPERQRTAVTLTYTSGLSNAEAAAVMEVSVKAFEALLVRAKRELRRRLADGGAPEVPPAGGGGTGGDGPEGDSA